VVAFSVHGHSILLRDLTSGVSSGLYEYRICKAFT
jgi:hypothetical protein